MAYGFILVVEDDELQRNLYVDALRAEGYEVASAVNGEQVLALLQRRIPRLVILDINLAGSGGFEICKQIRTEFGSKVTVIFFTSSRRMSVLQGGIEAGGDDFLVKEGGIEGMLERVSYWMNARARSLDRSQRGNILKNIQEAASTADVARWETSVLASAQAEVKLDPATDENLTVLLAFVNEARGRAPAQFGRTVEQKLYLLGYVSGAVNLLANSSLVLKIRFVEYLKATLRGANILDDREIEVLFLSWHSLYEKPTFAAASERGGDDFQFWKTERLPPHGLRDFAIASPSEKV